MFRDTPETGGGEVDPPLYILVFKKKVLKDIIEGIHFPGTQTDRHTNTHPVTFI